MPNGCSCSVRYEDDSQCDDDTANNGGVHDAADVLDGLEVSVHENAVHVAHLGPHGHRDQQEREQWPGEHEDALGVR